MSGKVSYNSHDYKPVEIVPAIASFDTDGHIKPLYVRIDGCSLRVVSSRIRCIYANTIEFQCQVQDLQYVKPLLLVYYQAEGAWAIVLNA